MVLLPLLLASTLLLVVLLRDNSAKNAGVFGAAAAPPLVYAEHQRTLPMLSVVVLQLPDAGENQRVDDDQEELNHAKS